MKTFATLLFLLASAATAATRPQVAFSTYIGGSSPSDYPGQILYAPDGNLIITGETASADFNLIPNAKPNDMDVFVAKLTPDGSHVIWAKYFGGSSSDVIRATTVGRDGTIYIAGQTMSADLPVTPNAAQKSNAGGEDGFVAKFSPDGDLLYATYIGGSHFDSPFAIAVDRGGNFVIAGGTASSDYPLMNAFLSEFRGPIESIFVTRFAADGHVTYSTFLGDGAAEGIDLDEKGQAYVTGFSQGQLALVNAFRPRPVRGIANAIVAKLTPAGDVLFSTYLGPASWGSMTRVARDGVWIAGPTQSADFLEHPTRPFAGSEDAFLLKVGLDGQHVLASTYLGGSGSDVPEGIALLPDGSVAICGSTSSIDFPTRLATQGAYGGRHDGFVTLFSADLSTIRFSTFIGGSSSDSGNSIAVNDEGMLVVTGNTESNDFPTANALQPVPLGSIDDFIIAIDLGQPEHQRPVRGR